MNISIKKIVLFSMDGDEQKSVEFEKGLNIITGDSKTGKSAILEIVNYCLFSSRSTIPKGVITEYTRGFATIFQFENRYIVIGRSLRKDYRDKAYFSIETDESFLESFSFSYFKGKKRHNIKNNIQNMFESCLGLSISDTREDFEDEKKNYGKATIRSAIPFLFQHQNLIANKHSLFYRFDDYYKRKATVTQTPILLGWVDGNYYRYYREYEEKIKELKVEQRLDKRIHKSNEELHQKLFPMIEKHYNLIGEELEKDISLENLKKLGKNLPTSLFTIHSEREIGVKILELEDRLIPIKRELIGVKKQLKRLDTNEDDALSYGEKLVFINETIDVAKTNNKLVCPVCNNQVSKVENLVKKVINSKENLDEELSKIGTYIQDSSEEYTFLQKERDSKQNEIKTILSDIQFFKDKNSEIASMQSIRDQSMVSKGAIEEVVKQILDLNSVTPNDRVNMDILEVDISRLNKKLNKYSLEYKYKNADIFLEKRMNEICSKLDFEAELKPGRLKFELETFTFYYEYKGKERISLSEMGSGANWLACHLSVFIALLHLSCREGDKSSIPSFLFLDQPSQVYFPRKYPNKNGVNKNNNVEENIEQVKNIFKVLGDELKVIEEDCGFVPQIIVMEHADEKEFNEYVRKRWSKDGEKLI